MIKILKTNGAKGQKERERIKEERPTYRQTSSLNDRKKTNEQTKEMKDKKKTNVKFRRRKVVTK